MDINQILSEMDTMFQAGRMDKAELILLKNLDTAKENEEWGVMLTLFNELMGMYRCIGREKDAVILADEALTLVDDMGLRNTETHGITLINAATANRVAGYTEKSMEMFRQAESIFNMLGKHASYGMTALYNNISQIYQELGQHVEAVVYLSKALSLLKLLEENARGNDAVQFLRERAITEVNLGLSLMLLGKIEESEMHLDRAADYFESEQGESDTHCSAYKSARAQLLVNNGEVQAAHDLMADALEDCLHHYGECTASQVLRKNLDRIDEMM